MKLNMDIRH